MNSINGSNNRKGVLEVPIDYTHGHYPSRLNLCVFLSSSHRLS